MCQIVLILVKPNRAVRAPPWRRRRPSTSRSSQSNLSPERLSPTTVPTFRTKLRTSTLSIKSSGSSSSEVSIFYHPSLPRFTYDRPFHKGEQDPDNEFVSLWIERTTFTSSSEFPGILKWFEVVKKEVSYVSPLQFACESMLTKNDELQTLIREYSSDR